MFRKESFRTRSRNVARRERFSPVMPIMRSAVRDQERSWPMTGERNQSRQGEPHRSSPSRRENLSDRADAHGAGTPGLIDDTPDEKGAAGSERGSIAGDRP
jgi:hypothetical protein